MLGIETWFLEIITKVYDAMGWPGVVFLMGVESAAIPFLLRSSGEPIGFLGGLLDLL